MKTNYYVKFINYVINKLESFLNKLKKEINMTIVTTSNIGDTKYALSTNGIKKVLIDSICSNTNSTGTIITNIDTDGNHWEDRMLFDTPQAICDKLMNDYNASLISSTPTPAITTTT